MKRLFWFGHRSRRRVLALAITGCACFAPRSDGAIRTWIAPFGGTFNAGTNWGASIVPTSTDTALFNLDVAFPYNVTFIAPATVASVNVGRDQLNLALGGNTFGITNAMTLGSAANDDARVSLGGGTLTTGSALIGSAAGASGLLTIAAGAAANLGGASVGGNGMGLIQNNGGRLTMTSLVIGASSPAGAGTINLDSINATLNCTGSTTIGSTGSGTIALTNGAAIATGSVNFGTSTSGHGYAQINNSGWTSSGAFTIGAAGAGSLLITNGGSLTSSTGQVGGSAFSATSAARGDVMLSGSGSKWTNTLGLTISRGALTATNGAQTTAGGTFLTPITAAVGDSAVGVSLIAHGSGTTISAGTCLFAGGSGTAPPASQITIDGGATVSANLVSLANFGDTRCDVVVDGLQSQLNATTGALQIAAAAGAIASLHVDNGATVSAAQGFTIGSNVLSSGTLELANRASITSPFDCSIGGGVSSAGTGFVSVASRASLNVAAASRLRVFANGTLRLDGGTVAVGSLDVQGGAFEWNSGTLAITGSSGAIVSSVSSLTNRLTLSAGQTLSAAVNVSVPSGGLLALGGGALRSPSLSASQGGEVDLNDASSVIALTSMNNAGLIRGDGRFDVALSNGGTGEVRAENGKRLTFVRTSGFHSNSGLISLLGGAIEFSDSLQNIGRITGRGTLVVPGGGVDNSGTVTFSAGLTDAMANFTNQATGKIIVTGGSTTTFYGAINTATNSELRVSTNSTGVFLSNVSGPGAITGSGVKDFEAGGTQLRISGSAGTTRIGPAANVSADVLQDGALFVEGALAIAPNVSAANTTRIGTLAIDPAGQLDLTNNDAIVTATPASIVTSDVRTGYNFGSFDGTGGIVSSAARNNPVGNTALGLLSGDEYVNNSGAGTFDGVTVAPTDVLIKYTYFGDVDFNGQIDSTDYNLIDFGFLTGASGWANGDVDYSGAIDSTDYNLIDFAFVTQNGFLRRAIAYLDGTDRSIRGMNDPSLQDVIRHFDEFGNAYAQGFLSNVPEPTLCGISSVLIGALASRPRNRGPRQPC